MKSTDKGVSSPPESKEEPDGEPTDEEIREYAEYLGMNLVEDEDLLWIAREGFMAPVPEPWTQCATAEGDVYFFNKETNAAVWEHPLDEKYKAMYQEEKKKKMEAKKKPEQEELVVEEVVDFPLQEENQKEEDGQVFTWREEKKVEEDIKEEEAKQALTPRLKDEKVVAWDGAEEEKAEQVRKELEEKAGSEMQALDEEYKHKTAETERKKDQELEKLKHELDTVVQEPLTNDLEEYEKQLHAQLIAEEEKLRTQLEDDFQASLQHVLQKNNSKIDNVKRQIEEKYTQQYQVEKNALEERKQEELAKIKEAQQARIKTEREAIDSTASEEQKVVFNAEKNEFEVEQEKKFSAEKSKIETETTSAINEFKRKLAEDRAKFVNDLNQKQREEIASEIAVKRQQESATLKTFVGKKLAATEKHNLSKAAIEKEYEIKTRLLPEPKLLESEKLKAELKFQELLRDAKAKSNKEITELTNKLANEEKSWAATLDQDLSSKKQEYANNADECITKLQDENAAAKKSAQEILSLAADTRQIKTSIQELTNLVARKQKELESTQKYQEQLRVELEELSKKQESFAKSPEPPAFEEDQANELQQELAMKKAKIAELENSLVELRQKTADISHERVAETVKAHDTALQIQTLNTKLEEIKQVLMHKKQVVTKQRSPEPRPARVKGKTPVKQQKLREIVIFVNEEKARLLSSKKTALTDYNVSLKLLKSLQCNLDEWNEELSRSRIDEIHQPILGDLKEGLDRQADVLSKQVERLKREVVHDERKLQALSRIEVALNDFYRKRVDRDVSQLTPKILEEYESYLRRYGKDRLGHELRSGKKLSVTEDYKDNESEISWQAKEEPIGRRPVKRGLRTVYKDVLTYNDVVKNMYQRDIIRLTRNRNAIQELYANEEKWLRQMKSNVTKYSYAFPTKL